MVDRNSSPPSHLVFTDLDGTLLDHNTYGWEAALPALDFCRKNGIPVILVSSKTRSEMDGLRRELNLSAPFVSENGGGIFFPREATKAAPADAVLLKIREPKRSGDLWQCSLGVPYTELIRTLRHMRKSLRISIKGFSDMDVSEISQRTGLDEADARLAAMREYDEPFIFEGETPDDLGPLHQYAAQRGLMIVSGGRFHHLLGNNHKGNAMMKIASWYDSQYLLKGEGAIPTIALGDSPNDFPMLLRADFPVLVLSKQNYPDLKKEIPNLEITQYPGPKGWNTAILNIVSPSKEKAHA
ncbi:MAG: hypothetical protein B6240_09160 [Desulfobacteraceae bacterium 4572_87]|nr:MAG: hypothetical protein B6240_09160 [Desulfobacteraceae bacterium 4572_87]